MSSSDLKMYIVVNSSLSLPQYAVQACHASHEYLKEYWSEEVTQDWLYNHKTIVILSANMQQLMTLMVMLRDYTCFWEPDMQDLLTAIAFTPTNNPPNLLSRLPLLS